MANDQQFCLRWNNHQSTLISVFDSLLENGTLVDCTLAAEGQYLKAHKVVLSACSPYLETLLSQHYEKHPIVILKDVKFSELKSMMDYMYRGEVNISQDQLGTFLKAAESLQIKGLSDNGDEAVGTSSAAPKKDAPRPSVTQTARPIESKRPAPPGDTSDASRDGSISPSSLRKRRRTRRPSQGEENHLDSNVCDTAQSTPIVPAVTVPAPVKQIVKQEPNLSINETGLKKEIIDPPTEPLLEPKTEYLDYMNNENSIEVEDLTLDDDDDLDSSMDNSRPGPSHGDMSNQGYPAWPMGDQSGTDEIFMAAQEAVGAATGQQQRDSQELDEKEGLDNLDLDWNNIHCTSFEEVYGPMDLREEESIMVDLIGDETSYNETELNVMIQEMIQQVEQNQKKKSFSKRPRKVKPNYNIRSVNGTLKEVCETKDSREKAVCSEDKTIEGVDLLGDEISCDSSKFNDMIQEMKSNTEAKKVGQNRKKKRSKPTMKPKPNCKIPSMKKALEKVNGSKNSRTEAMSDDDETIEVVDLVGDETSNNNSELNDKSQETKQKVEQNQKKEWLQKPSKKFYPNPNTLAVNKALREKGKPYLGRTKDGTMVQRPARMLGPACVAVECTQRQRYCRSITQDERQQIFSWCWNELNWPQRRQYVCSLVKRTSAVSMLRKSAVLAYQLEVGDKLVPVCKSMFLNTLGVTGREMMWWTQEKPESSMAKVG